MEELVFLPKVDVQTNKIKFVKRNVKTVKAKVKSVNYLTTIEFKGKIYLKHPDSIISSYGWTYKAVWKRKEGKRIKLWERINYIPPNTELYHYSYSPVRPDLEIRGFIEDNMFCITSTCGIKIGKKLISHDEYLK